MTIPGVMLQGTGSDVGKSLLVAGLCRLFTQRGLRVRPFKPQNMSNNAAVTADGGEIGRAQALQARACRVPTSVHMNPVLLKPETETGAQLVVQGRRVATLGARDYQLRKAALMGAVLDSYKRLADGADLILVEGAGSPAEVNLRAGDIANMGFAEAADLPVVLVADIERGGVIASLVGTHAVISETEQARIRGYIINKFRGDVRLFDEGLEVISRVTGWPTLGVVPYSDLAARLPAEDAVALSRPAPAPASGGLRIAVPRLSRIANFDDFDPLLAEPDVTLEFVAPGKALPGDADLIVLPGSKSTLGDLAFLREQGWDIDIRAHLRRGGWLLGICAGFQMLGRLLSDPEGVDGPPGSVEGLGLLDIETTMGGDKALVETDALHPASGVRLRGYEMHIGRTSGPGLARPFLQLSDGRPEGAISHDGRVFGCYLHGLFQSDAFRAAFLDQLTVREHSGIVYETALDAALDGLADHLAQHLDIPALQGIIERAR